MNTLKNTWGFYKWYDGIDDDRLIHPDDIDNFKKTLSIQLVFHCIDEDQHYITIQYENSSSKEIYRVKPEKYELLKEPSFKPGEKVKLKSAPEIIAEICEIAWHFQKNDYMFFIKLNGKKKSKRYFQNELEKE